MDKIKNLLAKAGCNPELVEAIGESFAQYKTSLKEQYEKDFATRIQQAKKVCVEETEAHKRELARRLQIFCEAKTAAIEAQASKQAAMAESVAQEKLNKVHALLEGINLKAEGSKLAGAVIEKAKAQIRLANEERTRAIEKANRQTAIAEKVLRQNRQLVTENTSLKKRVGSPAPISEGRKLDTRKRSVQPVSTRATLVENQERRVPHRDTPLTRTNGNGFAVTDIAAAIDEDLI
jgi:uncharacterized protein YhbP (UPF0306 family)